MRSSDHSIEVDGARIEVGTSLYDTEYDRVLWITEMDEAGVIVEPVTTYEVDQRTGWSPGPREGVVAEGTAMSISKLESLIARGRLAVGPR